MIYLHVPFCRSFCTYCDFYSELCKDGGDLARYAEGIGEEVSSRSGEIFRNVSAPDAVNTFYIGGGTPSVLPLAILERLVRLVGDAVSGQEPPSGDGSASGGRPVSGRRFEEFTIEVNPEDIVEKGLDYAKGLLGLGINRVSMGVQSFDDGILRWMNRRHDSARAVEAFRILRTAGVGNISLDLIFGLGQLSDRMWEETLDKALELRPEHISAYQLSIEEGSALGELARKGRYTEASEQQCRRQYDTLCRRLSDAGFHHYEVSNFALPGCEARHNSAYWRRVPYVGLGPGAHSLSPDGVRSWNSDSLGGWTRTSETLDQEAVRLERIMLPLRTSEGLPSMELRTLADPSIVDRLLEEAALAESEGRIHIPENRFFVSDEIIRELV